MKEDSISEAILEYIQSSDEPLETKEIEEKLQEKKEILKKETITRTKVFYRLNILRAEQKIKGKFVGSGKGVWIWWSTSQFTQLSDKLKKEEKK